MIHESTYAKPYKTVREQVALLSSRGMDVGDPAHAESLLSRIGYYRLSGYWYPYREREIDADGNILVKSSLQPGTTLQHVCAIYDFDRSLRAALFDALEVVEVAIRFHVGHTLGHRDIFAHRKPECLDPAFAVTLPSEPDDTANEDDDAPATASSRHQEWLERFDEQERRSQEAFATHFRAKYGPHLPVWVATEVMSFGTLAQLYTGAAQDDRERIAAALDLIGKTGRGDATLLSNWLNHIRYIRNLCAHHSRMWNRSFDVELASAGHIPDLAHLTDKSQRRLYGTIAVLSFLLARTMPDSDWRHRVRSLIETSTKDLGLDLDALGFPVGWEFAGLWGSTYERDATLAKRVTLLTDLDVASRSTTRGLLHEREEKDRRSWLNYLMSRHALVWASIGEAKLFPTFQIDPSIGNIFFVVGDINADLFARLMRPGITDEDVRWQTIEWWVTPTPDLHGSTPQELLRSGDITLAVAQSAYPDAAR